MKWVWCPWIIYETCTIWTFWVWFFMKFQHYLGWQIDAKLMVNCCKRVRNNCPGIIFCMKDSTSQLMVPWSWSLNIIYNFRYMDIQHVTRRHYPEKEDPKGCGFDLGWHHNECSSMVTTHRIIHRILLAIGLKASESQLVCSLLVQMFHAGLAQKDLGLEDHTWKEDLTSAHQV